MSPVGVTMVAWNRPRYLRRALDGWAKVRGSADAVFRFHIEPGCEETIEMCKAVDFAESSVHINLRRLGHDQNVYSSMAAMLGITDYAIQAVDDYVPATDLLELHAWHRDNYRDDPTVLALTSGRDVPAPWGGLAGVWRCQLIGALSGFHRHKWERVASRWPERVRSDNWWWWIDEHWLQGGPGYDVLFPAQSRALPMDEPGSWFIPAPEPQDYFEVRGFTERGFQREIRSY